jgi:glucose-6-phosphate 1-dehydrogenase
VTPALDRLALLGATGDLAGRYLFPALAALVATDRLPKTFTLVGAAREDLDDEGFRRLVADRLDHHAPDIAAPVRERLLQAAHYRALDLDDPSSLSPVIGAGPVAVYCALPPATFGTAIDALAEVGLTDGSRLALEKPFGEGLDDARGLNEQLRDVFGDACETTVFRVDHVLGLTTLHNLLGARLANRTLSAVWNSDHIDEVQVLWDETLALEGRAGYYDTTGALEDVVQNHLLQIMAVVAMEPPASLSDAGLRDARAAALQAVRPISRDDAARTSRRARYTAGTITEPDGTTRHVPSYVDESGVEPSRATETFAEVRLEVDTPRWRETSFVLRTGKALRTRYKGVVIRFRAVAPLPFDTAPPPQNELRIGLDGPETFTLHLTGTSPGPPTRLHPLTLATDLATNELPAYAHVLLDVLEGDTTRAIRADEAELGWAIMTPVLEAWADGRVTLEEYPAGSDGPPRRGPTASAGAP